MLHFAVIGHPVAHSLSPVMHTANFRAIELDAEYSKFDVETKDLAVFLARCKEAGFLGLNVTVPHKTAIMPLLDSLDDSAQTYSSVNTIKFLPDGSIRGYNTDIIGFAASLTARGFSLRGAKVGVVGCGGAGSVIALACALGGAAELRVAARTRESESRTIESIASKVPGLNISALSVSSPETAQELDLIVNASPVGLRPGDESVLGREAFRRGQLVLDIIPTRSLPPTAALAQSCGADVMGGLEFLVAQGAASFEIWTGLKPSLAAMREAVGLETKWR